MHCVRDQTLLVEGQEFSGVALGDDGVLLGVISPHVADELIAKLNAHEDLVRVVHAVKLWLDMTEGMPNMEQLDAMVVAVLEKV